MHVRYNTLATSDAATPPLALGTGSPFFGARLEIEYHRICPTDKSGMVNIDCAGPMGWHYADIGSHHGAQVCSAVDEAAVLAFGAALSRLVKKHFGKVRPLLESDIGQRGANVQDEPRRPHE